MNAREIMEALLYGEIVQQYSPHLEKWLDVSINNECVFINDCKVSAVNFEQKSRMKPKTILINGFEVPEPERKSLDDGSKYYFPSMEDKSMSVYSIWQEDYLDKCRLSRGLIHLTKEAATTHAKALLSFTSHD
jgi:hypothetical protein